MQRLFKGIVGKVKSYVNNLNATNPNIMVYVFYGILYDIGFNMYRPFAIKFLERIGGTPFDVSLFYSLPGLVAAFVLLPGSIVLSRFKLKKNVTSLLFFVSRALLVTLAFVPLFPAEIRPLIFVCLIGLINFPEALAQTSLQGFLGNVFSGNMRATAIALRSKFGNMTILLVTLITGTIISTIPKTDAQTVLWYQIFFVLAFVLGIAEIKMFRKFREVEVPDFPQKEKAEKIGFSTVLGVFKDKTFMSFLATTIVFQFVWQAGWPLTSIYQIHVLKSSEFWLALYAIIGGFSSFFWAGFWAKKINKHGNGKVLIATTFFMAFNMLFTGLAPNPQVMALVSFYFGFSTIGFTTVILNGLLTATPDKNRLIYLAFYNTCSNITLFLSPLVSGKVLEIFGIDASMKISFVSRLFGATLILINYRLSLRKKL